MHEEQLFEMVNEAIAFAKNELETTQNLKAFAMMLYRNGFIESISVESSDHEEEYDLLVEKLREKVAEAPKVSGVAIVASVNIPAQYKAPVESGIRVHLEERHKSDTPISGRFLYVPYQLFKQKDSEAIEVHLHNPIPVGIPQEIFIKEL